jgi:hypothetical protein
MSMKNSNDTIGNQTRDLPVCSVVPQPPAPPHAPHGMDNVKKEWIVGSIDSRILAQLRNCWPLPNGSAPGSQLQKFHLYYTVRNTVVTLQPIQDTNSFQAVIFCTCHYTIIEYWCTHTYATYLICQFGIYSVIMLICITKTRRHTI